MKNILIGVEKIECPNCKKEGEFFPNALYVICTCGWKYLGRGKWLSTLGQLKDI